MVKHIVLWKLKDDPDKQQNIDLMIEMLKALVGQVEGLVSIEMGYDFNPASDYDVALYATLKTPAALRHYQNHPAHVKCKEFIGMVNSYETAILFQISLASIGDDIGMITKIAVDLENLCAHLGYYKAFGMGAGSCMVCRSKGEECDLEGCKYPNEARPSGEACGVDIHKTIENNGYDILGIDEENDSYFCYGLVLLE